MVLDPAHLCLFVYGFDSVDIPERDHPYTTNLVSRNRFLEPTNMPKHSLAYQAIFTSLIALTTSLDLNSVMHPDQYRLHPSCPTLCQSLLLKP